MNKYKEIFYLTIFLLFVVILNFYKVYNGINLFEGTTPAPAPSAGQGQGALAGVAAGDSGVDISKLMNKTSAIWQKMSEK